MSVESNNAILEGTVGELEQFIKVSGYRLIQPRGDLGQVLSLLPVEQSHMIGSSVVEIFQDRELLIEVEGMADLKELRPSQERYAQICRCLGITGISVLTRETQHASSDIHTREFAPLYGYLEDPVCGLAAGAIATYMGSREMLRIEQGHFCNTEGIINVRSLGGGEVYIGGACRVE